MTIESVKPSSVDCKRTAAGTVWAFPSGGGDQGRYMSFGLDSDQPKLLESSKDVGATWQLSPSGTPSQFAPMSFPWTVSRSDPLDLMVIVSSKRLDCTWKIDVEYASGNDRKTLTLDDDGQPFRVVGVHGLPWRMYSDPNWLPDTAWGDPY